MQTRRIPVSITALLGLLGLFLLLSISSCANKHDWLELPAGWSWSAHAVDNPTAIGPVVDGYQSNIIIRESVFTGELNLFIERSHEFLTNAITTVKLEPTEAFDLNSGLEARKTEALNVDIEGADSGALRQVFYYIKVPQSHVYTIVYTVSNARPETEDQDIDQRIKAFNSQPLSE